MADSLLPSNVEDARFAQADDHDGPIGSAEPDPTWLLVVIEALLEALPRVLLRR